jgi:hypothetical protein
MVHKHATLMTCNESHEMPEVPKVIIYKSCGETVYVHKQLSNYNSMHIAQHAHLCQHTVVTNVPKFKVYKTKLYMDL